MKFANCVGWTAVRLMLLCLLPAALGQGPSTTIALSWPAFTTAAGQLVAAGSTHVTIATNGSVSVNLAPNQGATPAGEYYTAVLYLSDGSTHTQYWVVPAT